MAARTWFTPQNTPPDVDLPTLNRAARIMQDGMARPLTHTELVAIRASYRPGLSAHQIADAADEASS